ncbi:hypothetical protein P167DRAFT_574416 [Morchella conica CCBAS932]|uniref:Uncharacterized protein n=1 Tax=Morchella conica CCBAS932 TaxID=1392247 RepID=A0A3N4KS83_9PEZI|nr:hypothetical protein P167DRAFT_574416 [Morchella conica CCBAS932]
MRPRPTTNQPRSAPVSPLYPGVSPQMNAALVDDSHTAYSLACRMGAQRNNEQIRALRLEMFTYAASIGLQVVLPWSALKDHYPVLLEGYMDNIATHFHARYGWDRELCEELLGNIFTSRELRRAAGFPTEEGYDQIISARPGSQTARVVEPPVRSTPVPPPAVSPAPALASPAIACQGGDHAPAGSAGVPEADSMDIDSPPVKTGPSDEAPNSVDGSPVIFRKNVQDLNFLDPASIAAAGRQLGLDSEREPFSQEHANLPTDGAREQPAVKVSVGPINDLTALFPKPTYVQPPPMLPPLRPRATTVLNFYFPDAEEACFALTPDDNYDVFLELIRNRTVGLVWSPNEKSWYKLSCKNNYDGMWLIVRPGSTDIFLDWVKIYQDIVLEGNSSYKLRCYSICN